MLRARRQGRPRREGLHGDAGRLERKAAEALTEIRDGPRFFSAAALPRAKRLRKTWSVPVSGSEAKQFLRIAASDKRLFLLGDLQALHRGERIVESHVEAVVAAERDLVGPDQPHEIGVDAIVVADGVVGEAPQIFARRALHVL